MMFNKLTNLAGSYVDRSRFFQVLLRASADLDYACSLAAYELLH